MPTKLLDRLLFAQGGLCFFCKETLPKADASVEHLVAASKGGGNVDENRVACCKTLNAMFGSMSLKEKFYVTLNQHGHFKCPAVQRKQADGIPQSATKLRDRYSLVVANLKQRGTSKPRTIKTLRSTMAALFAKDVSEADLDSLVENLLSSGKIVLTDKKVSYLL